MDRQHQDMHDLLYTMNQTMREFMTKYEQHSVHHGVNGLDEVNHGVDHHMVDHHEQVNRVNHGNDGGNAIVNGHGNEADNIFKHEFSHHDAFIFGPSSQARTHFRQPITAVQSSSRVSRGAMMLFGFICRIVSSPLILLLVGLLHVVIFAESAVTQTDFQRCKTKYLKSMPYLSRYSLHNILQLQF